MVVAGVWCGREWVYVIGFIMCAVRKWVYVIGSIMCVVKEGKICGVCVGLCHSTRFRVGALWVWALCQ